MDDLSGLLNDLRLAIERDEFIVHYQPLLRIADASLYGFEALVRWQHPRRGLLGAGDFVPIAEQHGLIGQIDTWVLRTACRQGAAWQEAARTEPPLTMAVNVSAAEFLRSALADRVQAALQEFPLVQGSLVLEVTETTAPLDPCRTGAVLDAIRHLGVRLAVDDFGAGSHALSHLRLLRLDSLKLDRSFVAGIEDGRTACIVSALIKLGHDLDMDVVAEGVESAEQVRILREQGCDLAQGHFFAPALSATEASRLLALSQPEPVVGKTIASGGS